MRRLPRITLAALFVASTAAAGEQARRFVFEKADLGRLPAGWKAAQTGKGMGSVWRVVADETAPGQTGHALAQTAKGPGPLFNLCVLEGTRLGNVEVCTAFKAVAGRRDQGGGLVWRYQDANNYYVARYNPLEDNYRLYKVVAGRRTQLASKEGLTIPAGEWHTLCVRHVGEHIECSLDGQKLLQADDTTIPKAGAVGLWTKADAQTYFDNVRVRDLGR